MMISTKCDKLTDKASTYFHAHIGVFVAAIGLIIGLVTYCYVYQISIKEFSPLTLFFCIPLPFLKLWLLYFLCAKSLERMQTGLNHPLNSRYAISSLEVEDRDRTTLHDLYQASGILPLLGTLYVVAFPPLATLTDLSRFGFLLALSVFLNFPVIGIGARYFSSNNSYKAYRLYFDVSLITLIFWSLAIDAYGSFNLKPHYPIRLLNHKSLLLSLSAIPIIFALVMVTRHYLLSHKHTKNNSYGISFVISAFIFLAAPHQFNTYLYFIYTGGGRPIIIKESDKEIAGCLIYDGSKDFIAWPKGEPSPLKYARDYADYRHLNEEKQSHK
ncbi:hypothetical protein [Candidatus Odyssella thessalonicensis]|uniref:hypothetical protein n=1 Tax=Candidatus Odyssella thessalonicensis TaxID=84647 RepID=UPI000225B502|nr:hypothetical protein [Candidatus Odyssella thessalonicensis]